VSLDGEGDFDNIAAAVAHLSERDEIVIAPGVYTGLENRNIGIVTPRVAIRARDGAGTVTLDCQGGAVGFGISAAPVTLTGVNITNGQRGINAHSVDLQIDSCSVSGCAVALDCIGHTIFRNGEIKDNGSIGQLHGNLLISASNVSRNRGALTCETRTSVTLMDNVFSDNTGGIADVSLRGVLTAQGNVFSGNSRTGSGGVFSVSEHLSVTLSGNRFIDNSTEGHGGAVYIAAPVSQMIELSDNVFLRNTSGLDGGAVWLSVDAQVTGNTFVENRGRSGSSLWVGPSRVDVRRNIFAFNHGPSTLSCGLVSGGAVDCNDMFGNESGDTVCGSDPRNNYSQDPLFCAGDELTLNSESPCAANASPCGLQVGASGISCYPLQFNNFHYSATPFAVRLEWNADVSGEVVGIDVYRKEGELPEVMANQDGPLDPTATTFTDVSVDPGERYTYVLQAEFPSGSVVRSQLLTASVPRATTTLAQNHPNPFNPETIIEYTLPETERVTIDIFDVAGRRVANLVSGIKGPGEHTVRWDGELSSGQRAATGVYFYRLETRNKTLTRKMVLLK
jgi:hypothetical protein